MPLTSLNSLETLPIPSPSQVRLVFAQDVNEFLVDLKIKADCLGGKYRLVSMTFDRLPNVKSLIEDVVAHLAEIALSLFPQWYGDAIPFAQVESSNFAFESHIAELLNHSDPLRQAVSLTWLKTSRRLCRSGEPPIPREFPSSVQATQVALAIDPAPLLIALLLGDHTPPAGALLGLARTAEWLACETNARVLVVVAESLATSTELDSINFGSVAWPRKREGAESPLGKKVEVTVSPVIGRPHPFSRGEQLLARRLTDDAMLAGLFRFNIQVRTQYENQYLVDLVWTEGKVVVEVDGYEFHSDRRAFSLDRRRDYELVVSGYLVLRLPHDEIVEDVDLAVEKIRDVVKFRRSNDPLTCETPL
jgi:very-short-patch-repair endonuclease